MDLAGSDELFLVPVSIGGYGQVGCVVFLACSKGGVRLVGYLIWVIVCFGAIGGVDLSVLWGLGLLGVLI